MDRRDGSVVWSRHRARKERRPDGSAVLFGAAQDASAEADPPARLARSRSSCSGSSRRTPPTSCSGSTRPTTTSGCRPRSSTGWGGGSTRWSASRRSRWCTRTTARGSTAGGCRRALGRGGDLRGARVLRADGGYSWFSIASRPVLGADDGPCWAGSVELAVSTARSRRGRRSSSRSTSTGCSPRTASTSSTAPT